MHAHTTPVLVFGSEGLRDSARFESARVKHNLIRQWVRRYDAPVPGYPSKPTYSLEHGPVYPDYPVSHRPDAGPQSYAQHPGYPQHNPGYTHSNPGYSQEHPGYGQRMPEYGQPGYGQGNGAYGGYGQGGDSRWPPDVTTASLPSRSPTPDHTSSGSVAAFEMARRGYAREHPSASNLYSADPHDPYAHHNHHSEPPRRQIPQGHPPAPRRPSTPTQYPSYPHSDYGGYMNEGPRWNDGRGYGREAFHDPRFTNDYAHSDFGGRPAANGIPRGLRAGSVSEPGDVDFFDPENKDLPRNLDGAIRDPIIKARQKSMHTRSVRSST
eukprot:m.49386 g.49386  ORF g.49386 m.49386 type:complete len:324 (+) comp8956_c0_seq3:1686-2657(+)